MTAPPERAFPQHRSARRLGTVDDRAANLIESEIVIVDDDGMEEPFDPDEWFA
ncbi:hypothetical protein [Streptomyces sp. NPDC023838]|uniref:hypothetical protein n=1 Tax=Streptomyces sp. NPDC023838 TaxID=3154325 RepID=UPI0033FEBAAF